MIGLCISGNNPDSATEGFNMKLNISMSAFLKWQDSYSSKLFRGIYGLYKYVVHHLINKFWDCSKQLVCLIYDTGISILFTIWSTTVFIMFRQYVRHTTGKLKIWYISPDPGYQATKITGCELGGDLPGTEIITMIYQIYRKWNCSAFYLSILWLISFNWGYWKKSQIPKIHGHSTMNFISPLTMRFPNMRHCNGIRFSIRVFLTCCKLLSSQGPRLLKLMNWG